MVSMAGFYCHFLKSPDWRLAACSQSVASGADLGPSYNGKFQFLLFYPAVDSIRTRSEKTESVGACYSAVLLSEIRDRPSPGREKDEKDRHSTS